jgi:polar amino acid transport system substrate-binding protein
VSRGLAWCCAMLLAALCAGGCERLPRDPHQTLAHVREGRLRVGLVEHHPWVIRRGAEPAGVEVDLIRDIAKQLNTTPEWHWGGEQEQMESLENFELDLLAGGFTHRTAG